MPRLGPAPTTIGLPCGGACFDQGPCADLEPPTPQCPGGWASRMWHPGRRWGHRHLIPLMAARFGTPSRTCTVAWVPNHRGGRLGTTLNHHRPDRGSQGICGVPGTSYPSWLPDLGPHGSPTPPSARVVRSRVRHGPESNDAGFVRGQEHPRPGSFGLAGIVWPRARVVRTGQDHQGQGVVESATVQGTWSSRSRRA